MRKTAFESLIFTHLSSMVNIPVIFSNEEGTRPPLPYITILVNTGVKVSDPSYENADNQGNQKYRFPVNYSVSVQAYDNSTGQGIESLEIIQERLNNQASLEFRQKNGLGLLGDSSINDISALLGSTRERRFSLDLLFGTMREVIDNPNYIENVAINGTVDSKIIDI